MYSVRSNEYYSSPQEVVRLHNISNTDYGFETEEEFDTFLKNTILLGIKNYIDLKVKDFSKMEEIPALVHMVAFTIASEFITTGLVKQQTPTVSINDIPQIVNAKIITSDIKDLIETLKKQYKRTNVLFDILIDNKDGDN